MSKRPEATTRKSDSNEDPSTVVQHGPCNEVSRFLANLSEQDKVLIVVKRELYGGAWDSLLIDLKDRLQGRPYVFKLAGRIQEDIERISRLRAFERKYGIDLADYVDVDQL